MHTILERALMAVCVLSFALAGMGWWVAVRLAAERPVTRQMRLQAASRNLLSQRKDIAWAMAYKPDER